MEVALEAQVLVAEGEDHQLVGRVDRVDRPQAVVDEDVVVVAAVVAEHHLVSASLIDQIRAGRDGLPTYYGPHEGKEK